MNHPTSPHVVVIGGGISGLSAAWQLALDPSIRVTLLEREPRLGGKIVTEALPTGADEGGRAEAIVDSGPESFITRKPAAWDLALELGLRDQVRPMAGETSNIYVLDGGVPVRVPLSPAAFVTSPLLSPRGKARLLAEPFVPARRDDGDESLADFASRRLGREALDKFLGPILGGIYNTDPERQSVLTTSPVMREMERESGGLFAASLARARAKARRRKELASRGETLPPSFMTFDRGAQVLVDTLVDRLRATGRVDLRTGVAVTAIEAADAGYRVLVDGESLPADAVILATPANVAARLVDAAAPEAAGRLRAIRHASIGTVTLLYKAKDLLLGYPISGLMIPRREHRAIDAVTFTSVRFPERTPAGHGMVRIFFGGSAPHAMALDDDELLAAVRGELRQLLGLTGAPVAHTIWRWPDSYPQADVGHLERVVEIERALPPGLYVTGSPYRGLGVPDCVAQGRATAQRVVERLRVGG